MGIVEHGAQDVAIEGADLGRKGDSLFFNHFEIFFHAHPMVACLARKHLVKDHAECPNITFFRIMIILVGLWRHILWRANIIK